MPQRQEHRRKAFSVGSILLIAYDTPKFDTFTTLVKSVCQLVPFNGQGRKGSGECAEQAKKFIPKTADKCCPTPLTQGDLEAAREISFLNIELSRFANLTDARLPRSIHD